jgi:hypothetical protein
MTSGIKGRNKRAVARISLSVNGREWCEAKTQFAIMFDDRFVKA